MTRILYTAFDRVPEAKGASRHIQAFLRGLTEAGFTVDAGVLGNANSSNAAIHGARLLPLPNLDDRPFFARVQGFATAIARHARTGAYALWHVRSLWDGAELARTKPRPPLVYEVNGLPSIELPEAMPRLAQDPKVLARIREQEAFLVAEADLLITPSQVTANLLAAMGGQRIQVIPNGIDRSLFTSLHHDDYPELLYTGTFHPWQGVETAIRALAHTEPGIRLRLVGPRDKGEGMALQSLAHRLGLGDRVLIQPPVSQPVLFALMARARLCLAPLSKGPRNLQQGACPLKLIEYAATGCPTLASRLPLVETLLHGQTGAQLIAPDKPTAWAQAIDTLWKDEKTRQEMGKAGRLWSEGQDWQERIKALVAGYRELGVVPQRLD